MVRAAGVCIMVCAAQVRRGHGGKGRWGGGEVTTVLPLSLLLGEHNPPHVLVQLEDALGSPVDMQHGVVDLSVLHHCSVDVSLLGVVQPYDSLLGVVQLC